MNSLNEHMHPIVNWSILYAFLDLGPWTLDSPAIRTSSICMKKIPNITNRDIVTSHSAIENPIGSIQISLQIKTISC